MTRSYEEILPVEQWQQILANVPPGDLCNVVMTSKHMNNVASYPNLWAGMKVNMKKVWEMGLGEFYAINRFRKVTKMNFSRMIFTCEDMRRLLNDICIYPLENIDLSEVNLSRVPASLLANSVSYLQTANLYNTHLSTDQSICLLEAILSSHTLLNLNLTNVVLSQVPVDLLAQAISHLRSVNLSYTYLTTDQCVKLLDASASSNTLVNLNLRSNQQLCGVPSTLLAKAISHLNSANLNNTHLTTDQSVKLLEASISSSTLATLDLTNVDLSQVPSPLLAKAISHLRTVNLSNTCLTTVQSIHLLEASLSSNTLVNINLANVDLSGVPSDLLARAIFHLQTINLSYTYPTTDQCTALLEASLSSRTLLNVNLRANNSLKRVEPDLLARAVSHLQSVNLGNTALTADQCAELMKAIVASTRLVDVNLWGNQLRLKVPAELLASVRLSFKIQDETMTLMSPYSPQYISSGKTDFL